MTARRDVFRLAGAGLIATGAVSACSVYSDSDSDAAEVDGVSEDALLAKTADIPVGAGTVFADQKVVVTQPTEGFFQAFSAVCTHSGCLVNEVSDGTINCPCHGSKYAIEDGSVTAGPAPRPLEEKTITIEGDSLRLG